MKLEQYLRGVVSNKLYKLIKLNECEVCGSVDNLEYHHLYQFVKMLDDTLTDLDLEYKEKEEYTCGELEAISSMMIGKHMLHTGVTVCNICHDDLHKEQGKQFSSLKNNISSFVEYNKLRQIKYTKLKQIKNNNLIDRLHLFIKENDSRLFKDKQLELKELFAANLYVKSDRSIGMKTMNAFMEDNNLPYKIESKRVKIKGEKYTTWVILKK